MSSLTLLNLRTERAEAAPPARRFEPLARNAFRTLGVRASASQREVFDAAASARLALKLGVRKSFERDAAWLEPVSRTDADVRDAVGRLSDPSARAFERLFWFHSDAQIRPASNLAELRAQTDALLLEDTPQALHDAALLALAGLQRLDPALKDSDAWTRALQLWRETVEREEFWSLLVAEDLNGDFEQVVTFGEVRALRLRAPRLVSAPVAEHARDAVVRGNLRACVRAFRVLRAAALPRALLEEYERDTLGPAEDRLEEACNAIQLAPFIAGVTRAGDHREAANSTEAWNKFENRVKPALRDFFELGGPHSPYVRRALERAADKLKELAERFRSLGLHEQARSLLRESHALAPPGSDARAQIEAAIDANGLSASVSNGVDDYAGALARELALRRVPPALPKTYEPPVVNTSNAATSSPDGCASVVFWVLLIVSCFALKSCEKSTTRAPMIPPPVNFRTNMNYNLDVRTPAPVIIPPYVLDPSANHNASRRNKRRATPRAKIDDTMPLNINITPPRNIFGPPNRNEPSGSRNAPR